MKIESIIFQNFRLPEPRPGSQARTENRNNHSYTEGQGCLRKKAVTEKLNEQSQSFYILENMMDSSYQRRRPKQSIVNLNEFRKKQSKKIVGFTRKSKFKIDEHYLEDLKDQYSYQTKQGVREGKTIYINLYDSGRHSEHLNNVEQKINSSQREESHLTNENQQNKTQKYIEEQKKFDNQKEIVKKNLIERMYLAYNNALKQLKPGQDAKYINSQIAKYKQCIKFKPVLSNEEKRMKLIQENRKNILNKINPFDKRQYRATTEDLQQRTNQSNLNQTLSSSQENLQGDEKLKKTGGLQQYQKLIQKLKQKTHYLDNSFKQLSQEDNQESILRRIRAKQQQLMNQPDSGYSKEVIQKLKSDFIQILEMSRIENYINL